MKLLENIFQYNSVREFIEAKTDIISKFKSLENSDFQNRGGAYPKSGKPDTIIFNGGDLEFSFKNTPKNVCKSWVKKYLEDQGFTVLNDLTVYSDGDYLDDWNICYVGVSDVELKSVESVKNDLPKFLRNSKIRVNKLTEKDINLIISCCKRYFEAMGDGSVKRFTQYNCYIEIFWQNQYGPLEGGLYGVIDTDGLPDIYNSNGESCILDFKDENDFTGSDIVKIRKN